MSDDDDDVWRDGSVSWAVADDDVYVPPPTQRPHNAPTAWLMCSKGVAPSEAGCLLAAVFDVRPIQMHSVRRVHY